MPMHDTIGEYIACKLLKSAGFNVQEVSLVHIQDELCVAIEIRQTIYPILDMKSYIQGQNILFDLDRVQDLAAAKKGMDIAKFKQHIFELVYLSYIFLNQDLHPGNIGLIKRNSILIPSEIYDFADSLLSRYYSDCTQLNQVAKRLKFTVKYCSKQYDVIDFYTTIDYTGNSQALLDLSLTEVKAVCFELPAVYHDYLVWCFYKIKERTEFLLKGKR